MSDLLSKIKNEKKRCYLAGDYNINLLNAENHLPSSEFVETMFSYAYFPMINRPTRVSCHSATLIDNIFFNGPICDNQLSGILYADISAHFPVFIMDKVTVSDAQPVNQSRRMYGQRKIASFNDGIINIDWSDVLNCHDLQKAYDIFFTKLHALYEKCFPIRRIKSSYCNKKPWLYEHLKNSIKTKE